MNSKLILFLTVFLFLLLNSSVLGAEIQYAEVKDIYNSKLHIQYDGPGGKQNFVCDVVGESCDSFGSSTPSLFVEIDGDDSYSKSHNGKYAVLKDVVKSEDEADVYLHKVYDISGDEAELVQLIPYFKDTVAYRFPWAGEHVMLFGTDGPVVTYNIKTGDLKEMDPEQSYFPMRSLSPYGSYLSAYDYIEEEYRIWNTENGEVIKVPSEKANFIEFSQDEKFAAFVKDPDGYETAYLLDLESLDEKINVKRIFKDDFTVDDYIFFKNDLYIVGNTEDDPYRWVLYRYNVRKDEVQTVAENVSYESYMRPVGEYGLSFLVIDGKNTNVAVYKPEENSFIVLEPVNPSPSSTKIKRSVLFFERARGVLYEPIYRKRPTDLFVWLHGGPRRQTSLGYNSSLIYAVYDDILERLVESGAFVLKIDYTGSYGHGNELMDSLDNNFGVLDVEDVIEASEKIQRRYNINKTYLFGLSYGGYLGPKVLVEAPNKFDGVIAVNGVFDWFTLFERTPTDSFTAYFNGLANLEDLEENYFMYKNASVYKNLPQIEDEKILLIYGEDDEVVPTWQTREFFYQADIFDKDVRLLKIENEGHLIKKRESLNLMCDFISEELEIGRVSCD